MMNLNERDGVLPVELNDRTRIQDMELDDREFEEVLESLTREIEAGEDGWRERKEVEETDRKRPAKPAAAFRD